MALPLGRASFAPARCVSVTGGQFGVAVRFLSGSQGWDQPDSRQRPRPISALPARSRSSRLRDYTPALPSAWRPPSRRDGTSAWHTVSGACDGMQLEIAVDGIVLAQTPGNRYHSLRAGHPLSGLRSVHGRPRRWSASPPSIYDAIQANTGDLVATGEPESGRGSRCSETWRSGPARRRSPGGIRIHRPRVPPAPSIVGRTVQDPP
jgi:hypothetical protein